MDYLSKMVSNIKKNWEPGTVDLTATDTAYLVVQIHGGQSVMVKNIGTAGSYIELYPQKNFTAGQGLRLFAKETANFSLPKEFGEDNIIEIWAVPQTAGDDVNFAKVIDKYPEIKTSERLG